MRILLATDGSKSSTAAVNEVARRPFPKGSKIQILSVFGIPPFPIVVPWAGVDFDDEVQRRAEAQARNAVEAAARKLAQRKGGDKLSITTKVVGGSPKEAILKAAETFKADLIVVGSHGLGRVERFLMGSVSSAVVAHAKCSVEVVRGR